MGPRVVVAEDNGPFRAMLVSVLTANGYSPIPAEDGHEALLAVKESAPAAMLLDVSLPGMSGVRVAEVLRSHDEWKDLPVIGMSGYELAPDEAPLFSYFLEKPIVLAELLEALDQLVPKPPADD